ncbi:MAG: hypothetical protein WED01_03185 [Candidatus Rokuibacteriota bacterium]
MAGVVALAAAAWAGGSASSVTIPPALLAEARARGTARSIVEMRVPAGATEAEIESVKRRVLGRIARTKHQVLRELTGLPMLVLEASAATLQALAASPDVLRVDADAIDAPQR